MKWPIVMLIAVGTVAAFLAAVLVTAISTRAVANPLDPQSKETTVLVAKHDLAALTVVTAEDFEEVTMSINDAPKGHMNNSVQAVGRVLMLQVKKGQAMTKNAFASDSPGTHLAATLRPGMRAVAVNLANYAGIDGLLYPGAYVDVLASFEMTSRNMNDGKALSTTLLQGVQVLSIENKIVGGQEGDDVEEAASTRVSNAVDRRGRMITLLVNTRQAEALQLAMEHGVISLSLRNPTDGEEFDRDATVLAEGRLARLAEFLQAAVTDEQESPSRHETSLEPVSSGLRLESRDPQSQSQTQPQILTPQNPQWNIQILRGTDVEVRSFDQNEEKESESTEPIAAQ